MNVSDTNVILLFILQDDAEQAAFAKEQMSQNKYLIPIEMIAEIVYVLSKVYKNDRAIHQMIDSRYCVLEKFCDSTSGNHP